MREAREEESRPVEAQDVDQMEDVCISGVEAAGTLTAKLK